MKDPLSNISLVEKLEKIFVKAEEDSKFERCRDVLSIKGLWMVEGFISLEEEIELLRCIDKEQWSNQLTRRTQHYGHIYDYTSKGASVETTPIPSWCDKIIERLMHFNVLDTRPDQMIVNEYTPGQGIYPHVDNIDSFEDGIVSLSLGSDIVMDLVNNRNAGIKKELLLRRRSILAFHGDAKSQIQRIDKGLHK